MSRHRSINARHLRLISAYSLKHAVRGGAGLVYLLLALSFGLTVANAIISPVEVSINDLQRTGAEVDTAQVVGELLEIARPAVVWAVGEPTPKTRQRSVDGMSAPKRGPTTCWMSDLQSSPPSSSSWSLGCPS